MSIRARKLLFFAPLWIVAIVLLVTTVRLVRARLTPRVPMPFSVCVPDPVLGQVLKAGFVGQHVTQPFEVEVRVNSLGMRGPETTKEKPKGIFRVAFVGDSFAFGWGVDVDHSFVGWLRAWWKTRTGTPAVEVLDLAVPGWSPDQVLVRMRRDLFDFAPDLVVLQLCVNDLPDIANHVLEVDARRLPLSIKEKPKLSQDELREALHELKREYGIEPEDIQTKMSEQQINDYVRKVLAKSKRTRAGAAGEPPVGEIASLAPDELARALDTGPIFQARYLIYLLEAIERECAERHVQLRFLMVDDGSSDDGQRAAMKSVRSWLESHGDAYLDADRFLPFVSSEDFFRGDPHWTIHGHWKAALVMRDWLEPALPK